MQLDKVAPLLDLFYRARSEGLEAVTPHLVGAPGIGKSAVVRQWSQDLAQQINHPFLDYDCLNQKDITEILDLPKDKKPFIFADKRITGLDPIDFSGIPRQIGEYIRFLPLDLAKLLSVCPGILFLDEFLNERRENMKAAAFKLTRDYKVGDIAMSKDVLVVAASNSAQHSSLVDSICKPLRDRFVFIEVTEPTIESWTDWMDKTYKPDGWDRSGLAYLRWKPNDFLANVEDTGQDDGIEPPATPRGWTIVLTYLQKDRAKNLDRDQTSEIIRGKLGSVGERYAAFMENKVPTFEELCKNPKVIASFGIEQKYLTAVTIAEAINQKKDRIKPAVPVILFIAEKDDREIISALFSFLAQPRKAEVFQAVRENPVIFKAMERTGKALL